MPTSPVRSTNRLPTRSTITSDTTVNITFTIPTTRVARIEEEDARPVDDMIVGGVVDDGIDPDQLLAHGQADADHQHGPDPRFEQLAPAGFLSPLRFFYLFHLSVYSRLVLANAPQHGPCFVLTVCPTSQRGLSGQGSIPMSRITAGITLAPASTA